MRRWPAIDLMKLYTQSDHKKWNTILTRCHKSHDVLYLQKTLYGIQAGMDDLAKQKLNDEKINLFFIRLQRSIYNTAKKIFREKYPHPLDDPMNKDLYGKELENKRSRDREFEKFIINSSY